MAFISLPFVLKAFYHEQQPSVEYNEGLVNANSDENQDDNLDNKKQGNKGIISANSLDNNKSYKKDNYYYTDHVVNPYTKKEYYIKKASNEGCGINGSWLCELVEKTSDGDFKTIIDLNYPYEHDVKGSGRKDGAELIKFIDKENLIVKYGYYDHGGGGDSIYKFNLKTNKLAEKSIVAHYVVDEYENKEFDAITEWICKKDDCLGFVNDYNNEINKKLGKNGIFYNDKEVIHNISYPYDVDFDILDNYENEVNIFMMVNGEKYKFNKNKNTLELVK